MLCFSGCFHVRCVSLLLRCFDDSSACFRVHVWFHFCCVVPFYGCFFGVFLWFEGLLWLAFFLFFKMSFLFAWLFSICLKHLFCDFHSSFQFWFPHFPYFFLWFVCFLVCLLSFSVIARAARIDRQSTHRLCNIGKAWGEAQNIFFYKVRWSVQTNAIPVIHHLPHRVKTIRCNSKSPTWQQFTQILIRIIHKFIQEHFWTSAWGRVMYTYPELGPNPFFLRT